MESTCRKEKCELWQLYNNSCPNFIETVWVSEDTGELKSLEDCAPRRILLEIQAIRNRLEGVQKSNEQQRNESNKINFVMSKIIESVNTNNIHNGGKKVFDDSIYHQIEDIKQD